MPNRILRESICTSASIDTLSPSAELLFYRLLVKADDFGRFHADPTLVLAACFPRKIGKVKPAHVRRWLVEIVDVGTIRLYQDAGQVFLWFPKWTETQRSRANVSKFPQPPTDTESSGRELLTPDSTPPSNDSEARSSAPLVRSSRSTGIRSSVEPDVRENPIGAPPTAAKRGQDAIFEALAEGCGIDWHHLTPSARGELNAATKALREAGDASPAEISYRVRAYRLSYPGMAVTPSAIGKHWPALANGIRRTEPLSTADRILIRSREEATHGEVSSQGAGRSAGRGLPPA